MSVYVDDGRYPYGRMIMCHMLADSTAELHAMADKIGVARRWLQKTGTPEEHYDISLAMRRAAVAGGAIEMRQRDIVQIIRWKRGTGERCNRPHPEFLYLCVAAKAHRTARRPYDSRRQTGH